MSMPVYLDCAATTPMDPRVREALVRGLDDAFGNPGSRTHAYGQRARALVEQARDRVARLLGASRGEVIFTSGATESNNLALLGLAPFGEAEGRRHIVSTAIEHHAVLEPLAVLGRAGFEVTLVPPTGAGVVEPEAVRAALRPDTLLVSVMHVNNETGVIQPVAQIADLLEGRVPFFHVDAAQSAGRGVAGLDHARVDLVSISGHKMQGPPGIGALVTRRRDGRRPPIRALAFGGQQERGLRPGTLPVALVAALGTAAELAVSEAEARRARSVAIRRALVDGLAPLEPVINGDPDRSVPEIVNLSFPGVDAETAMEAWRDLVAISDGAACSSQAYTCSHVLSAMGLPTWRTEGALRLSWCAASELPDLPAMVRALDEVRLAEGSRAR